MTSSCRGGSECPAQWALLTASEGALRAFEGAKDSYALACSRCLVECQCPEQDPDCACVNTCTINANEEGCKIRSSTGLESCTTVRPPPANLSTRVLASFRLHTLKNVQSCLEFQRTPRRPVCPRTTSSNPSPPPLPGNPKPPIPPPPCPSPVPSPPLVNETQEDALVLTDCHYVNSYACKQEGILDQSCGEPQCFYKIKDSDLCRPPSDYKETCAGYSDYDSCLMLVLELSNAQGARWMGDTRYQDWYHTPCSEYEETIYYQVMEGNVVMVYCEVVAVCFGFTALITIFALRKPFAFLLAIHNLFQLMMFMAIIMAAVSGGYGWCFVWFFVLGFHFLYYLGIRFKLGEANLMMEVSVMLMKRTKVLLVFMFMELLLKCTFFMAWVYTYITANGRLAGGIGDCLLFLLFLFWCQLSSYVSFTTVAGSTATWYFGQTPPHPVKRALRRALTTSFGSVVMGATQLTFVKALRILTGALRTSMGIFSQLIGGYFFVMDYLFSLCNIYAFAQIAVYGTSFYESAKNASRMIAESGIRGMMMDDLLIGTSLVGAVLMGVVCVGAGFILAEYEINGSLKDSFNKEAVIYTPCFFIGAFGCGIAVLNLVEAISVTIYTCFAEEPHHLEKVDKEFYLDMVDAWYNAQNESSSDEDEEELQKKKGEEEEVTSSEEEEDEEPAKDSETKSSKNKSKEYAAKSPDSSMSKPEA
ncbi:hypothetical protein CYMTET_40268 [Cymbomonas tetramitiformis]|uniref:Choline transporter-like protein n=1 Tax=Cymbomonas tetramitiformis TaxID=36881 RepID=A0AAE0C9G4_9CHLO|nr:hypothetical protein CYMTET_40268 [Cymbomonas tetramitiformis]